MKCRNKHIFLLRCNNFVIYDGQHFNRIFHTFDIRRTNKRHRNFFYCAKSIIGEKAAQLSAVSIAFHTNIHRAKTWNTTVHLFCQQNQTGTGAKYRQTCLYFLTQEIIQLKLAQELVHHRAFTARNDKAVHRLIEVAPLANLEVRHAELIQYSSVLRKCALQRQNSNNHDHLPRSAISSAISFSLMPTMASPKSVDNSAISFASV